MGARRSKNEFIASLCSADIQVPMNFSRSSSRASEGVRFVCVHPARAWLWTGIAGRRYTLELHSTWFVEPGPLDAVAGTEAAVARTARGFVPATATWRTLTYRRRLVERSEVRVEESGMSIWGKLALTPLTLALDCLLAPVYAWFEDDDCDA